MIEINQPLLSSFETTSNNWKRIDDDPRAYACDGCYAQVRADVRWVFPAVGMDVRVCEECGVPTFFELPEPETKFNG